MQLSRNDELNWNVYTAPLTAIGPMGQLIATDKVAQVRDDNYEVLGITSKSYEVLQNDTLKQLVMPMVEEGLLTIQNMGFIGGGSKVFIQAQMSEEYTVAGDTTRGMISLLNSHDGTSAFAGGVTAQRVICSNTFAMAMQDMSKRLRHTAGVAQKALELKEVIEFVNSGMDIYTQAAEKLALVKCSETQLDRVIEHAFNKKEGQKPQGYNKIVRLFRTGRGNDGTTLLDTVNGITEYLTHESQKNDLKRFVSNNFGTKAVVARRAMDMALAMC